MTSRIDTGGCEEETLVKSFAVTFGPKPGSGVLAAALLALAGGDRSFAGFPRKIAPGCAGPAIPAAAAHSSFALDGNETYCEGDTCPVRSICANM
jgi:hypothetical protein